MPQQQLQLQSVRARKGYAALQELIETTNMITRQEKRFRDRRNQNCYFRYQIIPSIKTYNSAVSIVCLHNKKEQHNINSKTSHHRSVASSRRLDIVSTPQCSTKPQCKIQSPNPVLFYVRLIQISFVDFKHYYSVRQNLLILKDHLQKC